MKNKVWPNIRKIVQMFSGKCRVVRRATQQWKSGHFSMHSFRAVSSAAQPRSWDSHIVPTSLTSGLMPWFTCAKKSCQLSMNKKGRCTHDSRADDPRHSGQYPQKCNAHKQAEGDHFESFLLYLKKLFWILFQVLASFFFYESYFLSYALILGVSREKSYCISQNLNWIFIVYHICIIFV